LEVLVGDM